jgi:NADH-quinone oxidoreductase subunit L
VEADKALVDGAVMTGAGAVVDLAGQVRKLQNGSVRTYALYMVAGGVLLAAVLILGQMV